MQTNPNLKQVFLFWKPEKNPKKESKRSKQTLTYIGKATHCIIISFAAACSPLWQSSKQQNSLKMKMFHEVPPKNKLNSESLLALPTGRDKTQETRNGWKKFWDSISILIKQKCEWYLKYYIVCMWWMSMFHILLCMHLDVWSSRYNNLREVF
jgi:hypothetical protein